MNKINEFDFDYRKCKPRYGLMHDPKNDQEENKKVMVNALQFMCQNCRLCSIGCELIENKYNPHVLSNTMFNAKFMIIGQNPGIDECKKGMPLCGENGKIFDMELKKYKINRNKFYISNIIKCFIKNVDHNINKVCFETFLRTEIRIINPKLIILMGESVFNFFCPHETYENKIGKISNSEFGKIYAIYEPSKNILFSRQMELLSKLVKKVS